MAPFSVIVFGDRFRHCSVENSRIRSKTAPFSFENGLVWTGPKGANGSRYQSIYEPTEPSQPMISNDVSERR